MFLTRMALNPARRGARSLLASPHAMHAAILAAYPPGSEEEQRVLWRVDSALDHDVRLFVLSPRRPDLTHVVEQAGWPTSSTWETRDYLPLLERLDAGQTWGLRLVANPVHQVTGSDGRSRRLGHVTATQQLGWLLDRLDHCGMSAVAGLNGNPDIVVSDRQVRRFRRNSGTVTLVTARFDGHALVEDADRLRTALVSGVGRAKGYGCGLLTLAPARR